MRLLKLALEAFVLKYFDELKQITGPVFLMSKVNECFKVMLDLIMLTTEGYKLHILFVQNRRESCVPVGNTFHLHPKLQKGS